MCYSQSPTALKTWDSGQGKTHFIFSTFMSAGGCAVYSEFIPKGYSHLAGFVTAYSLGALWELKVSNSPSPYDLLWNLAGCCTGVTLVIVGEQLYKKKRRRRRGKKSDQAGITLVVNGIPVTTF